jgi:hypothetical protein
MSSSQNYFNYFVSGEVWQTVPGTSILGFHGDISALSIVAT